jgi:formylglycine-generating enzyme required for sulfatase activity
MSSSLESYRKSWEIQKIPPKPYSGNGSYAFVSYASKDKDTVYPIIGYLQERGCRIWYDQGIEPAALWKDELARMIKYCEYFILFVSDSSIKSDRVLEELDWAVAKGLDKTVLALQLFDKVQIPDGVAMTLKRRQLIRKHTMLENDFGEKVFSAVPRSCKDAPNCVTPEAAVTTPPPSEVFQTTLDCSADTRAGTLAIVRLPEGPELRLRFCPAGTYKMGERGKTVEVTLTTPFWIGESAVDQQTWNHVMGENPSYYLGDSRPVDSITSALAKAFFEKLNNKLNTPAWAWSLPTEAQWEYACRAGIGADFAFGPALEPSDAKFRLSRPADAKGTLNCRSLRPNQWGIYDMHGNVWELCKDLWDGNSMLTGGKDPLVMNAGSPIIRGGCWDSDAAFCKCWHRNRIPNNGSDFSNLGLRLAAVKV